MHIMYGLVCSICTGIGTTAQHLPSEKTTVITQYFFNIFSRNFAFACMHLFRQVSKLEWRGSSRVYGSGTRLQTFYVNIIHFFGPQITHPI